MGSQFQTPRSLAERMLKHRLDASSRTKNSSNTREESSTEMPPKTIKLKSLQRDSDSLTASSSLRSLLSAFSSTRSLSLNSQVYYLKPRTSGPPSSFRKIGLDWQQDPQPSATLLLHPKRDSPMHYSQIQGYTVQDTNNKMWLVAEYVKHNNSDRWIPAPPGAALPCFYKKKYVLVHVQSEWRERAAQIVEKLKEDVRSL